MDKIQIKLLRELIEQQNLDVRGRRVALFEAIVVETPSCKVVSKELSDLFKMTQEKKAFHRAKLKAGLPAPPIECDILGIVGDSHSGKTTAVKRFMCEVLPKSKPDLLGSCPMVLATLTSGASVKQMHIDMLRAFGDVDTSGTRQTVENRVERLARNHDTAIVAIDECQHLRSDEKSESLADCMKRNLQRGAFAIVLIGQEKQLADMYFDNQIGNRSFPTIPMRPCDNNTTGGVKNFRGFLAYLDTKMVEYGVFSQLSKFAEASLWMPLMTASEGYIGVASKLIRLAIIRHAKDDDTYLGYAALERACDEYTGMVSRLGSNPFRT